MSDFVFGIIFGGVLFGMPRVFFGTFHIWSSEEGWIMKWRTRDVWEREVFNSGFRDGHRAARAALEESK